MAKLKLREAEAPLVAPTIPAARSMEPEDAGAPTRRVRTVVHAIATKVTPVAGGPSSVTSVSAAANMATGPGIAAASCCRPKPPDGRRQATRELGGPDPLSVGPAARTCPEVGVCWACHLTYT
jgi:hypothetical protein